MISSPSTVNDKTITSARHALEVVTAEGFTTHTKPYAFPILLKCNNRWRVWILLRVTVSLIPASHLSFHFPSSMHDCTLADSLYKVHPANHMYSSESSSLDSAKSPWFLQFWQTKPPWVEWWSQAVSHRLSERKWQMREILGPHLPG